MKEARHEHSNVPSTFEPYYHECETLLMWLMADRDDDDDVDGNVDEPSVGMLLNINVEWDVFTL